MLRPSSSSLAIRNFSCADCLEDFSSSFLLERHNRQKHSQQSATFLAVQKNKKTRVVAIPGEESKSRNESCEPLGLSGVDIESPPVASETQQPLKLGSMLRFQPGIAAPALPGTLGELRQGNLRVAARRRRNAVVLAREGVSSHLDEFKHNILKLQEQLGLRGPIKQGACSELLRGPGFSKKYVEQNGNKKNVSADELLQTATQDDEGVKESYIVDDEQEWLSAKRLQMKSTVEEIQLKQASEQINIDEVQRNTTNGCQDSRSEGENLSPSFLSGKHWDIVLSGILKTDKLGAFRALSSSAAVRDQVAFFAIAHEKGRNGNHKLLSILHFHFTFELDQEQPQQAVREIIRQFQSAGTSLAMKRVSQLSVEDCKARLNSLDYEQKTLVWKSDLKDNQDADTCFSGESSQADLPKHRVISLSKNPAELVIDGLQERIASLTRQLADAKEQAGQEQRARREAAGRARQLETALAARGEELAAARHALAQADWRADRARRDAAGLRAALARAEGRLAGEREGRRAAEAGARAQAGRCAVLQGGVAELTALLEGSAAGGGGGGGAAAGAAVVRGLLGAAAEEMVDHLLSL